jgi:hypothetical protein
MISILNPRLGKIKMIHFLPQTVNVKCVSVLKHHVMKVEKGSERKVVGILNFGTRCRWMLTSHSGSFIPYTICIENWAGKSRGIVIANRKLLPCHESNHWLSVCSQSFWLCHSMKYIFWDSLFHLNRPTGWAERAICADEKHKPQWNKSLGRQRVFTQADWVEPIEDMIEWQGFINMTITLSGYEKFYLLEYNAV